MSLSPVSLGLVLTAALCHACWNLALKRIGQPRLGFIGMMSIAEALMWLPLALLFIEPTVLLSATALIAMGGSAALHIVYFWLLTSAYGRGDLGVAYPIARATGPLLTAVFAVLVLGERPTMTELLGALGIVLGSAVVGLSTAKSLRSQDWGRSITLALLCGLTIAAYTVWDQQAVKAWALPVIGFYWGQLLIRAAMCLPWMIRDRVHLGGWIQRDWRWILLIAVLSPLAYQLVLYAMTMAPLSLVAPLRETSILFAVMLGALVLKETDLRRRLFGALLMLVGLALVTLARV
jgi:drug/metabolite transporter (DMT)-like permease